MKVSISLGGSLLTKNQDSQSYIKYAEVIRRLKNEGHTIIVVCGGGKPARQYINLSKELEAPPKIQDETTGPFGSSRGREPRLGVASSALRGYALAVGRAVA